MGYDRIRYFKGADGESTLIAADKASARTVYGAGFADFATGLGFAVRTVVDTEMDDISEHIRQRVQDGRAKVTAFPKEARRVWFGQRLALMAVELRPPVDDQSIRVLNEYLLRECRPNDAGLIIDNRHFPTEMILAGY